MANATGTILTAREQYLADIKAHKMYLGTVIKDSQTEYSKQLLSLSSAILALSVAFLKNLVTVKTAILFPLLYTAWGLFASTIFLTLIAIKISIKAHKLYKDDIDKELAGARDLTGETWRDRALPMFNWLTTLCFFSGVLCLVIFAVTNVHKERAMPEQAYSTLKDNSGGLKEPPPHNWVEVQRIKPGKPDPPPPPPAEKPQQ